MKKVLTLAVMILFVGACVLTAFADDGKDMKEQPDYFTVGNKKTGVNLRYGRLADMSGIWAFDEKSHAQTALIADGNGSRIVFGSDDTKDNPVKLGLGVQNGKPYIWYRDSKDKVRSIDLEKLPLLEEPKPCEGIIQIR